MTRSILMLFTFALVGTGVAGALPGCMSQGSEPPVKGEQRLPATYTGRVKIGVYLIHHDQSGEPQPLYSVSITLDTPTADGWRKVELDAYHKSELQVGQSTLRTGDRISFEGYADELFQPYRRIRMAVLKNIRIIERGPAPDPRPAPAIQPSGPETTKDGSNGPWAPPPGFGPRPDKAKPASSTHAHAPQ